jgi:transketolase
MTKQRLHKIEHLERIAKLIRYYSLVATSKAGSGHPTSAMSATELMSGLFFGGTFRFDINHPDHPNNDRLIFSKGHATPLFYGLWLAAGAISEDEMLTYRQFGSRLEGHPTPRFPYADAATGSLGQGLSIGLGMALNARYLDNLNYRTYVLLGDSEMAEGSQWESIQLAAYYQLGNLIGVLDVNRLGQRGETMYGFDLDAYQRRISAFGWNTIVIDGHSLPDILAAFKTASESARTPTMIIGKTVKGKGVTFLENKNGWHGIALDDQQLEKALDQLGEVDKSIRGELTKPENLRPSEAKSQPIEGVEYDPEKAVPTRNAFGKALVRIFPKFPRIVSLDGEVGNSTRTQWFAREHPDRFFEMYIAEQNMVGAALGLSCRGKIPFVSTFAAFLTRAFDQIRMSQYSNANIKFVGSHAGISIGQDGPSQMGLEDIAMFRTIVDSVVLHPCDAVSTEKLVEAAVEYEGIVYLRTMRQSTPILYTPEDHFQIGGSKVLKTSDQDVAVVVGAGQTVHEALAAHDQLKKKGVRIRVIDLYSIKPIDEKTLKDAAEATEFVLTVEDHYAAGGLGEAVRSALAEVPVEVRSLSVSSKPRSGAPDELRDFEGISADTIVETILAHAREGTEATV